MDVRRERDMDVPGWVPCSASCCALSAIVLSDSTLSITAVSLRSAIKYTLLLCGSNFVLGSRLYTHLILNDACQD